MLYSLEQARALAHYGQMADEARALSFTRPSLSRFQPLTTAEERAESLAAMEYEARHTYLAAAMRHALMCGNSGTKVPTPAYPDAHEAKLQRVLLDEMDGSGNLLDQFLCLLRASLDSSDSTVKYTAQNIVEDVCKSVADFQAEVREA